ncbi:hypothetical protein ACIPRI_13905 [Variovorax sp. LARHSF232]
MMMSKTSLPRKSLHLPRQQKICAFDGKNDGKDPMSITAKSFNHAGLDGLLMMEWGNNPQGSQGYREL